MADELGITAITDVLTKLDSVTQSYTSQGYAALATSLTPSLTLAVTAYIAFVGWSTLQGWSQFTVGQATKHALKVAIAFVLATQWDVFCTFLYNVFTNGPNELSSILINATGNGDTQTSVNSALQDSFSQGIQAGEKLWQAGSWSALTPYLAALAVWVLITLVCGIALLEFAIAKCGVAITLVMAPVFALFLLWEGTKGIFDGWLRAALGFALIPLFLSSVLLLINSLIAMGLEDLQGDIGNDHETLYSILTLVLGSIAGIGLELKATQIATQIASGVSVSSLGAAGSLGRGIATVMTGGAGVAKSMAGKAVRGGRALGNAAHEKYKSIVNKA